MATQLSSKDMTAQGGNGQQTATRRGTQTEIAPPVDIFEDADGITLLADMPGVSKERLELRIDGTSLVLEGQVQLDMAQDMQPLHADVRSTRYRRTFSLSKELETERIQANLVDGVLTVRIPKRAEVRPRRIQIEAG